MGLFDTIQFDQPLTCPLCGIGVSSIQTKCFGSNLLEYRIGSVISGCSVLNGLIGDSHFCRQGDSHHQVPVFIGVWNAILVAVDFQREAVERRLRTVDRVDLVQWLEVAQNNEAAWKGSYFRLCHQLKEWHRHMRDPDASRLPMVDDEFLEAEDRLQALLDQHRAINPSPEG
jgi:hypothetical protein